MQLQAQVLAKIKPAKDLLESQIWAQSHTALRNAFHEAWRHCAFGTRDNGQVIAVVRQTAA